MDNIFDNVEKAEVIDVKYGDVIVLYIKGNIPSTEEKKIIEDNVAQLFDGKVKVLVVNYDTVKVGVLRHE